MYIYIYLELQTTNSLWLFQLEDSKSLHGKWLFHQTSMYKWLFGVPGENRPPQKEVGSSSNHPFSGAKMLVSGRVYTANKGVILYYQAPPKALGEKLSPRKSDEDLVPKALNSCDP